MTVLIFGMGVSFGLIGGWFLRGWFMWKMIERRVHDFGHEGPMHHE